MIKRASAEVAGLSLGVASGLFRSLFDFKFEDLITPKIIKIFYGLAVAVYSILAVIIAVRFGFTVAFPVVLIGVVIDYFFLMFVTRIALEFFFHEFFGSQELTRIRVEVESLRADVAANGSPPAPAS